MFRFITHCTFNRVGEYVLQIRRGQPHLTNVMSILEQEANLGLQLLIAGL